MRSNLDFCRPLLVVVLIGLTGLACGNGPAEPAAAVPPPQFYDARLDLADAELEKAIALVRAAQAPIASNPDKPFGGHDLKAIKLMEKAREEIALAGAYADEHALTEN